MTDTTAARRELGLPPEILQLLNQMVEQITALLAEGKRPRWRKPWSGYAYQASGRTGKPYRGFNQRWLWLVQVFLGYESHLWHTAAAGQKKGWTLRPGALGVAILRPSFSSRASAFDDDLGYLYGDSLRFQTSVVYNQDAFVGPPPVARMRPNPSVGLARTFDLFRRVGAEVHRSAGDQGAWFAPGRDRICLPSLGAFESLPAFAGTALHELVHWTGHRSRLARDFSGPRGGAQYAFEELVAELGAALLCSRLGVEGAREEDDQHLAYLTSWAQMVRDDPTALLEALRLATEAHDLLFDLAAPVFDDQQPTGPRADFPMPLAGLPCWDASLSDLWSGPGQMTIGEGALPRGQMALPSMNAPAQQALRFGRPTEPVVPAIVVPDAVEATLRDWRGAWGEGLKSDSPAPVLRLVGVRGSGAATLAAWLRSAAQDDPPVVVVDVQPDPRALKWEPVPSRCYRLTGDGTPISGIVADLGSLIGSIADDLDEQGSVDTLDWLNRNMASVLDSAYLACRNALNRDERSRPQSIDILIADMWADRPPETSLLAERVAAELEGDRSSHLVLLGDQPTVVVGPREIQRVVKDPPGAEVFEIDFMSADIPGMTARWMSGLPTTHPLTALLHRVQAARVPLDRPGSRFRKPFWIDRNRRWRGVKHDHILPSSATLPFTPVGVWSLSSLLEGLMIDGTPAPWLGTTLNAALEMVDAGTPLGLIPATDAVQAALRLNWIEQLPADHVSAAVAAWMASRGGVFTGGKVTLSALATADAQHLGAIASQIPDVGSVLHAAGLRRTGAAFRPVRRWLDDFDVRDGLNCGSLPLLG